MQTVQFENRLMCCIQRDQVMRKIAMIVFGSFLLALSAQIMLPIRPVPVTLQSFMALFIGMAFGPRMAGQIIIAYLCEGLFGMPVFAHASCGLPVLFGPDGGYLFGFVPAAMLAGTLLQKGWARRRVTIFFAALLGTVMLFIPGYFVLASFVGFHHAYLWGVAPFYSVEACKLTVFTFITPFFWRQKKIKNNAL
jgi:biotin transport system substrate-specific component